MTVTESPYRVNSRNHQRYLRTDASAMEASWNLIQRLGERIREEEDYAVKQMEARPGGRQEKSVGMLFEEMDGVWLRDAG